MYFLTLASAELCDAAETHQTTVVKLNQQLAEMSLHLSQMRKNETKWTTDSKALKTELEAAITDQREKAQCISVLEETVKKIGEEKATLQTELEVLQKEMREEERIKTSLAELKVEEMLTEKMRWEEDKTQLNSLIGEFQKKLNSVNEFAMAQEEERSSPTSKVAVLEQENCLHVSNLKECMSKLERYLEESNLDCVAETEILQERISELTQEKDTLAQSSARLEETIQDLKAQIQQHEGMAVLMGRLVMGGGGGGCHTGMVVLVGG